MLNSIKDHETWFINFANSKIAACPYDPMPMSLKLEHSMQVFGKANAIMPACDPSLERVCLLSALYHDIARFDQYLEFQTFNDRISFNHGQRAVVILKNNACLAAEPDRKIIYTAIGLHNRFALPNNLPDKMQFACNIVRDADKLDILRVIAAHLEHKPYNPTIILSLPDDDKLHSDIVIEKALAEKVPSYGDLKSVNDFRVLLASWYFEMHFSGSQKLFISQKHGLKLVEALPNDSIYGKVREFLLQKLKS